MLEGSAGYAVAVWLGESEQEAQLPPSVPPTGRLVMVLGNVKFSDVAGVVGAKRIGACDVPRAGNIGNGRYVGHELVTMKPCAKLYAYAGVRSVSTGLGLGNSFAMRRRKAECRPSRAFIAAVMEVRPASLFKAKSSVSPATAPMPTFVTTSAKAANSSPVVTGKAYLQGSMIG